MKSPNPKSRAICRHFHKLFDQSSIAAISTIAVLVLMIIFAFLAALVEAQSVAFGARTVASVQTSQPIASEKLFNVNLDLVDVKSSVYATVVLNFSNNFRGALPAGNGITEVYKVMVFANGQVIGSISFGRTIGARPLLSVLENQSSFMRLASQSSNDSIKGSELKSYQIVLDNWDPHFVASMNASLTRVGSIVFNGTSTDGNVSGSEVIQQVVLDKTDNNRYVYNKLPDSDKFDYVIIISVCAIGAVTALGAIFFLRKHWSHEKNPP